MEQRRAHTAGQRRTALQIPESRPLDRWGRPAERCEGVGDTAARQVCRGVKPAAVSIRTAHAHTGAAGDDHARIEGADVLDSQPDASQCAEQPVRQKHVGRGYQPAEELEAGLGLEVDRDAALAAIAQLEEEVGVGPGRFAGEAADDQGAPWVAGRNALHFDHVEAPVRQCGSSRGHVCPRRQFDHPHHMQNPTLLARPSACPCYFRYSSYSKRYR